MAKKVLIIITLTLFVFVGLIIFGNYIGPDKTSRPETAKQPVSGSAPINTNAESAQKSSDRTSDNSENMTINLARQITEQFSNYDSQSPLAGEAIDKLLVKEFGKFDYQNFKPVTKISDLKIIKNPSLADIENYLKSFQQILRNEFAGLNLKLAQDPETITADSNKLIGAFEKAIAEFYKLPAPENLVAFHQEEISLLKAQKMVFERIRNYEQDPVQALMAVKANEQINKELASLKETINNFIQKNNLNI